MKPDKRKIKYDDCKMVNYQLLVVKELFVVDNIRFVRVEDKRGDNKYFTEFEWLKFPDKKK